MIHNQFSNCQNVNITNIHIQQATEQANGVKLKEASKLDTVLADTLSFTFTKALPLLFTDVLVPIVKIICIVVLKSSNIVIVEVLAPMARGTLKGVIHVAQQHQLRAKESKLLEAGPTLTILEERYEQHKLG